MSTTADHTPESVNGPDPEGPLSVNSTPDPSTNTPADAPVNATDDDAANAAVTRGGNVVPIRPDTARTADEIPEQDRPAADDAEPGAAVRLVDPPATKATWWETAGHATARPLVARWLTSAEEFRSRARFLVRYAAHTTAFHALRVPVYVPTAFLRSFGATGRLVARLRAWVYDAESHPVRMNARDRADAELYMKLREIRNETVRRRMGPVMVGVVVLLAIVYLCITFVTPFWNWTGLVVAMTLVGWWGAPADKPVAGRAVDSIKTPNADVVDDRGTRSASLGHRWPEPGAVQGRPRHHLPPPDHPRRARLARGLDLPHGVTVADVIERRERLASGLRRPLGCVWPEADAEVHPGRLVLWVGDQDMSKATQPHWPLAKAGNASTCSSPIPFGTDQRGRWVDDHADVRLGAHRRDARGWARRSRCGSCCSSPRWTRARSCTSTTSRAPAIFALEHVAHRYRRRRRRRGHRRTRSPTSANCATSCGAARRSSANCRGTSARRTRSRRSWPPKALGLHPIVIGVDECQEWFEHPKYGAEFEESAPTSSSAARRWGSC